MEILCNKLNNPYHILIVASFAQACIIIFFNLLVKLCGIFGISSTQIGINHHFRKENNISDLQRKYIALNQIGFVLGSSIGLLISLYIGLSPLVMYKTISLISLIYLLIAFQSIKEISFETVNYSRGVILMKEYIKNGKILEVREVNKIEGTNFFTVKGLNFGCSIDQIVNKNKDRKFLRKTMELFNKEKWLIYVNMNHSNKNYEVMTSINQTADSKDLIEAFFASINVTECLNQQKGNLTQESIIDVLKGQLSQNNTNNRKELLKMLKSKGYDLKWNLLENSYYRYKIDYPHH